MSTAFEFDASRHFASVALDNSLGESKWDAIEKAGNDLKAKIAELDRAIVLMDLSKLEFMGSSVVALIVKIWKDIEGRQGGMVVVSPNEMTMEVLEISGLTKLWPVVKSRDEAEDMIAKLFGDFNIRDTLEESRRVSREEADAQTHRIGRDLGERASAG